MKMKKVEKNFDIGVLNIKYKYFYEYSITRYSNIELNKPIANNY